MKADLLVRNIGQLATPPAPGQRRGSEMRDLLVTSRAALAVVDGKVAWIGPEADWRGEAAAELHARGRAVVPGLIDPHTHAIWAGDRLADFEARAEGRSYEQILREGGGIRSTIRHTRAMPPEALADLARPRLQALLHSGATTVEVKSGYGFTPAGEIASLEAVSLLAQEPVPQVVTTLLIHVPPADAAQRPAYLDAVCDEVVPTVAARGLASAVDVFVERESFTVEEARRVLTVARQHGLALKLHADQFHALGGVEMAIELGALSVDHLEASTPAQISALAESSTIGTVLPGVSLHLGLPPAPARALVDAGATVAVGTDLNPGSSPLYSIAQALALAVRLNGLSPAEALTACTVNAAAALGLSDRGSLTQGCRADFLLLDADDWRELPYRLGASSVSEVWISGAQVAPLPPVQFSPPVREG